MISQPETVEALACRQVGFTVEILPNPHRWRTVYQHLQRCHGEQTPSGPVLNPRRLAAWHLAAHELDDAFLVEGAPTSHPHRHASVAGRIWEWVQWR